VTVAVVEALLPRLSVTVKLADVYGVTPGANVLEVVAVPEVPLLWLPVSVYPSGHTHLHV